MFVVLCFFFWRIQDCGCDSWICFRLMFRQMREVGESMDALKDIPPTGECS